MAGEDDENEEDPFNEENLQDVLSSPNPELMDFSFFDNPPNPPPPPPNESDQFLEELTLPSPNCDVIDDFSLDEDFTLSWNMFEPESDEVNNNNVLEENGNGNGAGNNVGETTRVEVSTRVFGENHMIFETGGPSTRPVPVTPIISDGIWICTCCRPLRTLVHTSGPETMTLDIYGGIGFFCHAILEIRRFGETRYQTIYLSDLGMEGVKKYIEDYCAARLATGFEVVTDTNAPFYRAMNAGSNPNQPFVSTIPSRGDDIPMSLPFPDRALNVPHVPRYVGLRDEVQPSKERPRRQTPLALQRERTGNMTLEDLGHYFNLPIEEAARKMNMCPTVVKKICRKGGLKRWPHRKIRSLEKKISALRSVLRTAKDPTIRGQTGEEIERLEMEIAAICSEILTNAK